ncbi:hypothetical protein GCM10009696_12290 [Kocuria himachalensis]
MRHGHQAETNPHKVDSAVGHRVAPRRTPGRVLRIAMMLPWAVLSPFWFPTGRWDAGGDGSALRRRLGQPVRNSADSRWQMQLLG